MIPPELVLLLGAAVRSQLMLVGLDGPLPRGSWCKPELGMAACAFLFQLEGSDWFRFHAWRAALGLDTTSN